jgi:hypothetical protein
MEDLVEMSKGMHIMCVGYLTFWHVEIRGSQRHHAEVGALLMNILMQSGYSPARWYNAVDALLPKKSGGTLIEKLRTIIIFQGVQLHQQIHRAPNDEKQRVL